MQFFSKLILVLAIVLNGSIALADDHDKEDIVDTAVAAGNFTTLVTAVQAAGLVETLKGKGPFTVFA
ncbi:MAG: fasciclin domain-containing protein, partial [Xanthomonadaceae bacterium]|nr:fasciclin domain-containing protein [Xanthomonadaceae bacterium]